MDKKCVPIPPELPILKRVLPETGEMTGDEARLLVRRDLAMEMRLKGMSFRDIGLTLGVSDKTAAKDVNWCITRFNEMIEDKVDALRTEQMLRYEKVIEAFWERSMKGDTWSADRLLVAMRQYEDLLGLKLPQRVKVEGDKDNPITVEYRQKVDEELLGLFQKMAGTIEQRAPGAAPGPVIDVTPESVELLPILN